LGSEDIFAGKKIKSTIMAIGGVITNDNVRLLIKPSLVFLPKNATIKQKKM
jgi:hypothetical protein